MINGAWSEEGRLMVDIINGYFVFPNIRKWIFQKWIWETLAIDLGNILFLNIYEVDMENHI